MKKTATFLTLMTGLLLFTACGDDGNRSVTTQPDCTESAIFDNQNNVWRVSNTDNRECRSSVNNPFGDLSCPSGQVAARVTNSNVNYPTGNTFTQNTHRSNVSNGFGYEFNASFCVSVFGNQPCPQQNFNTLNTRDNGRYTIPAQNYPHGNGVVFDGNNRVVCVTQNDRNLFRVGGVWHYEYSSNFSGFSSEEFVVGVLVGTLLGAAFSN